MQRAGLCVVLAFSLAASSLIGCGRAERSEAEQGPSVSRRAEVEGLLQWLPTDTETVMAATVAGSIKLSEHPNYAPALLSAGLFPFAEDWQVNYLYAVKGIRNFKPPTNLGMWEFEGCTIFAVSSEEAGRLRSQVEERADRREEIAGRHVGVIEHTMERDQWTMYALVEDGCFFVASDPSYLQEVLERRRTGQPPGRALDERLEQWKYIDRSTAFWAVRQFSDASRQATGGGNLGDPKLVGMAVQLDESDGAVTVHSISDDPRGSEMAGEVWRAFASEGLSPKVEPVDERVTRITFQLSQAPEGAIFLSMIVLGHIVFI
jgi:hypothetical protein